MARFFSQEGFLWRSLNLVTDIFALSVLWLLCSLPLITLGAATTALYDCVVRCIRYKQEGVYSRFFRTFRAELKISLPTTLLWAGLIALLLLLVRYLRYLGGFYGTARAASAAYYVLLVIPAGAACWVFPILSRFSFGFLPLNITAVKLCLARLPATLVLVLMSIEIAQLCIKWIYPMFFMPALTMLLWSLFIEPAFAKLGGGIKKQEDAPDGEAEESE